MATYADLEIGLHRREAGRYPIELRLNRPDSDAEERLVQSQPQGEPLTVRFDVDALRGLLLRPDDYGKLLGAQLFESPEVYRFFDTARKVAERVRVRLFIEPGAPELHSLRWETLRDPTDGACLLTNQNCLFSRYLSSSDWRRVQLRPQAELRALVVIANPTDLPPNLAPIDVAKELEQARAGLEPIAIMPLASGGSATVNNLMTHLQDGYDILYLVAHGILVDDEPYLWFEDEHGKFQRISGADLVTRLRELPQYPRLVVLVSCQTAGTGADTPADETGVLTAFGPRLAEAGVPAIIAMQGDFTMETAKEFMPKFFQELQRDGQIDRALAVARGTVRERPDWWMPVLFTRLKSGRIWYTPGFGGDKTEFEQWDSLKNAILEKMCTPILGPGLSEPWLGQSDALARRWAEQYRYPFASYEREDLPRIAQYIARRDSVRSVQSAFNKAIREELIRRCSDTLPEELRSLEVWTPENILKAIELGAERCWAGNADEAHRQLAELNLPIYITTSPTNLLARALEKKPGVKPQIRLCPWWSQRIPESKWRYDDEPTVDKPLVYHLFGHVATPESIVLSEDNYFDFLIGMIRNKHLIPDTVINAMTSTALMFLGFRTEEWGYRVLFRWLMAQEGSAQLREFTHVIAQVEPEEGRVLDTRRAHQYLEKAFNKDNISIYWGRSEDFLTALTRQLGKS